MKNLSPDAFKSQCSGTKIYLREFCEADAKELFEISQNRGFLSYMDPPEPFEDVSEALSYIEGWRQFYLDHCCGVVPIFQKHSDEMVGISAIKFLQLDNEDEKLPELMYRLHDEHWGKGYATEAGRLWLEYAKSNLNFDRIFAVVHPNNKASSRVLEKLGLKYLREALFKKAFHHLYGYKI